MSLFGSLAVQIVINTGRAAVLRSDNWGGL